MSSYILLCMLHIRVTGLGPIVHPTKCPLDKVRKSYCFYYKTMLYSFNYIYSDILSAQMHFLTKHIFSYGLTNIFLINLMFDSNIVFTLHAEQQGQYSQTDNIQIMF